MGSCGRKLATSVKPFIRGSPNEVARYRPSSVLNKGISTCGLFLLPESLKVQKIIN